VEELSIQMQMNGNLQEISLYFHIPFCKRKCDYCHFYVLPSKEPYHQDLLLGLKLEWERQLPLLSGKQIVSIYFGGGTPSLLEPEFYSKILGWVRSDSSLSSDAEITLEANPDDVSLEKMQAYASIGINRVSIGVQSLDNLLLKKLGRIHHSQKAMNSIYTTYEAGITNISIDLMYDLPEQTLATWISTLNEAVTLPISHLSLYNLTIEPHTAFYKKRELLQQQVPNEETSLAMYQEAIAILENAELKQYEISAFSKDQKWSRHNSGYWTARPFLGFGPSAFSYWEGSRFRNIAHLKRYVDKLKENQSPVDYEETLDSEAQARELFVVQLRLKTGVFLEKYPDFKVVYELVKQGYLEIQEGVVKLTDRGILCYDSVAVELI